MRIPFNKLFKIIFLGLCLSIGLQTINYGEKLKVITTTAELADITQQIGKEYVDVKPLVIKNWDIHHVEPRPSMVIQVKNADMVIRNGMSLDIWFDSILSVARNESVLAGAKGYVDASVGVKKLEIPTGQISQAMGDVHKQGNPHYMLDPRNSLIVGKTIRVALIKNDPSHSQSYQKNYDEFVLNFNKKIADWNEKIKGLNGKKAITYHKTWVYFFKYSGMQLAGTIEPVPGIPPTPGHISKISKRLEAGDVDFIILSPYYSDKEAKILASRSKVKLVSLPTSVEVGSKQYGTYAQMIDQIILQLSN